tara:strand:+ start:240 stop:425 length:186 start_codon:yes stop_codon:yes gene_type:complete
MALQRDYDDVLVEAQEEIERLKKKCIKLLDDKIELAQQVNSLSERYEELKRKTNLFFRGRP